MCWAERWGGINALRRVDERGVLDGREDMEVGERAYDAEEDNGLYRCVGGMQRERSEEGAHGGKRESAVVPAQTEKNKKRTIPPVLSNMPDRTETPVTPSLFGDQEPWLSGGVETRTRGVQFSSGVIIAPSRPSY
jgi:hypothetical protein